MSKNIVNIMGQTSYAVAAMVGAASGAGNRARTIPSKREKFRNPRLQRKHRNWEREQ